MAFLSVDGFLLMAALRVLRPGWVAWRFPDREKWELLALSGEFNASVFHNLLSAAKLQHIARRSKLSGENVCGM